jgi:hypothetical protein
METTKDLITDKAIKLVTDDYVSDGLINGKNTRKIIYNNLVAILKGHVIHDIPEDILYQLALITHDLKITKIGVEYIRLFNNENNVEHNKYDFYTITEAHGDENKTEITEIKIKSTGEKIRKGDTIYDSKTSKYFLDVDFSKLSNNLIRGKYNGSGLYSFIPLKNVRTTEINIENNENEYLAKQINKLWKEIGDIWSVIKKDSIKTKN